MAEWTNALGIAPRPGNRIGGSNPLPSNQHKGSAMGTWDNTYNRKLAQGHDHGSAAYAADEAEARALKKKRGTVRLYTRGGDIIVEVNGVEKIREYCPLESMTIDHIATLA